MTRHKVAVIGSGITGLVAAHRLLSLDKEAEVTLFEGSSRTGGLISTEERDGFLIERGPDAFITNKPGGIELCEELGFSDQLIPTDDRFRRSLVLRNGLPYPVPDGFMLMAPAKPWAIATTPVLSIGGKVRLLWEAFVTKKTDTKDESLADFVRRRFGNQALDRLVQPLVGGIYTSDPEKLSLQATLPRFPEMEQQYGSVIRATLAQQKKQNRASVESSGSGARYGLFVTPKDGFSSLMSTLEQQLTSTRRMELRFECPVRSACRDNDQWQLETDDSTDTFDAVIITLPTHKAADLLKHDDFTSLSSNLRQIEYASSAIVVSGHRLDDFSHPLDAFGLVVPAKEGRDVLAISFTSRKFPGRAPEGCVLLRTFVGGAMQPELLRKDDDALRKLVNNELKSILGMAAEPMFSEVVRYERAMPQYHVGHMDRIQQIENQLADCPGLYLAGSAYHGVGIPDSIASARKAAEACVSDVLRMTDSVSDPPRS